LQTSEIAWSYNKIYCEHGLRAPFGHYIYTIRRLGVNAKRKALCLDISCGEGLALKAILQINNDALAVGLDISLEAVKKARENVSKAKLLVADGQALPFKSSYFDFVANLGSLEHYMDPDKGCKEIYRVLKPTGKTAVILPNKYSLVDILDVCKTGGSASGGFQIIERVFTRKEAQDFLESNGLRISKVYSSNLWPEFFVEGTFKIKSIKKFIWRWFLKIFAPLNLTREFIFICNKGD